MFIVKQILSVAFNGFTGFALIHVNKEQPLLNNEEADTSDKTTGTKHHQKNGITQVLQALTVGHVIRINRIC